MSTDNYTTEDIVKHITKLRKAKGWSSYQLAISSGVYNSSLIRIEKFEREPKLSTVLKLIQGLGMSPREFFEGFG